MQLPPWIKLSGTPGNIPSGNSFATAIGAMSSITPTLIPSAPDYNPEPCARCVVEEVVDSHQGTFKAERVSQTMLRVS